jgi:hypothetical protein
MTDEAEKISSSPEVLPRPEIGREKAGETAPAPEAVPAKEVITEAPVPAPVVIPVAAPEAPIDPTVRSLEKILSEDLVEQFKAMPPADQAKFRAKGEETVSKLAVIMNKTVLKAKEVLVLIVSWLKLIPGVNKYFLEQESKIKTDKIIELHRRNHGE